MSDFWMTFFSTLFSILVGGGITLICSRYYYTRAGQELKQEASELRTLMHVVVQFIEQEGHEIARDEDGKPYAIRLSLRGTAHGSTKSSGVLVVDTKPKNTDKQ